MFLVPPIPTFVGDKIWISWLKWKKVLIISEIASLLFSKDITSKFSFFTISSFPIKTLFALLIKVLSPFCLNTSFNLYISNSSVLIKSARTFPEETDCNWFSSPSKTRVAPFLIAHNNFAKISVSTIDISSKKIKSADNVFFSFFVASLESSNGINSSALCIVFASIFVTSVILWEALPVGAIHKISFAGKNFL